MERSEPPVGHRPALALVGLALVCCALTVLGRASSTAGSEHALVWPLAGFLVLWLLHRGPRAGLPDAVVVTAAASLGLGLTGASIAGSVVGGLLVLLQPVVTVFLLARLAPGLLGASHDRASLSSLGVIGGLLLSLVGGALATTAVLLVLTVGDQGLTWALGLLWFLRDLVGAVVVVTVGLATAEHRAGRAASTPTGRLHRGSRGELLTALTFSASLFLGTFVVEVLPLAYPLLVATGWLALRFDLLVTTWHTAVFAVAVSVATLLGRGPFAFVAGGDTVEAASFLQAFVLLMCGAGLVVGAERTQVHALNAALQRSADAAQDQADLFRQMIEAMAEGVMVVDATGEVLVSNTALHDLIGSGPGRPIERLRGLMGFHLDGSRLAEHERPSKRALAGERVVRELVLYRMAGKPDRVLAATALPLPGRDPQVARRAMILIEDVTVEHNRRADLLAFAQMTAHDLRNPLTSITGWTGLMRRRFDEAQDLSPAELGAYLRRTEDSARRMDGLIEHLLDRATRDVEPQDEEVDLAALVTAVARERDIADLVTVGGGVPVVRADPGMLRQLVDNLLGNAVKYARPGVVPAIVVRGRMGDDGVVVDVADNGLGVPAGQHERIFTQGHRAHASGTNGQGVDGTGLGLAVCRRIVGRHGGTIRVVDHPDGPGAVIEVVLPMERVVTVAAGTEPCGGPVSDGAPVEALAPEEPDDRV